MAEQHDDLVEWLRLGITLGCALGLLLYVVTAQWLYVVLMLAAGAALGLSLEWYHHRQKAANRPPGR